MNQTGNRVRRDATPKQVALIWRLLDERIVDFDDGATRESVEAQAETLSSWEASKWIDRLMALPERERAQVKNGRSVAIPFKDAA